MEIVAGELEWTSVDAENFAKFLSSPTGLRIIPALAQNRPALLRKGDTNEICIRSGELIGYQSAIENLFSLAHPPAEAPKQASEYPDPANDAAWNDGKKLNDPNADITVP